MNAMPTGAAAGKIDVGRPMLAVLAAAVIETGGSARRIAAELMPDQYPTAAQLRFRLGQPIRTNRS